MSLDGFIAREDGTYDWIPPDPGVDFVAMYAEFDGYVMGRKTYELVESIATELPSMDGPILVVSKTLSEAKLPNVEIIRENIPARVRRQKAESAKDVWLFGGGELFRYLLDEGVVDTVEVAVIPVLLGSGVPLLPAGRSHPLKLLAHNTLPNGICQLAYTVTAETA
jgi:dihydrofolate reductase